MYGSRFSVADIAGPRAWLSLAPLGALQHFPWLAPWAAIFRRFAAGGVRLAGRFAALNRLSCQRSMLYLFDKVTLIRLSAVEMTVNSKAGLDCGQKVSRLSLFAEAIGTW